MIHQPSLVGDSFMLFERHNNYHDRRHPSTCSNKRKVLLRRWGAIFAVTTLFFISASLTVVTAMRESEVSRLRDETVSMFYHGFDNYMRIAFPEDELKPISCQPLVRDHKNPHHFELNDVLGNYSLTLIDSLSTLAILASAPPDERDTGPKALLDFQDSIAALVQQYGDGKPGPTGQGLRGRGFDVDSKVQVFETVIRGVGGLLSAHLFAIGELPITGYAPEPQAHEGFESKPIRWANGFSYDGQLLRLAFDLGQRLLPAFYSATSLPYPRVNLRYGIPFYVNSPLNLKPGLKGKAHGPFEITETCSAGAGSLVLEFTVLSRLTGDQRFEEAAKRAFWAVWSRRSDIGLLGAGVDAEGGHWVNSFAGIGAGVDSFFEYAFKSHILLSGSEIPNRTVAKTTRNADWLDPNELFDSLTIENDAPDMFLEAWSEAHAAIKRHLYSKSQHPHYVNANLATGSPLAFWIDSLGAYYAGLLALAGEVDEAIETHLLYTALWTRFAALPERWSLRDHSIESGLGWWPGRPEFIESTYYLYRATKDPWYLHVGEMVLRDISQNCWTACGWAGIQDVETGQLSDRMESFFLGETTKYMYLLFDDKHPLNSLDAPFVFTTEGHPLIIPRRADTVKSMRFRSTKDSYFINNHTCPAPPQSTPLTGSVIASRPDIFHAAKLVGLHDVPNTRTYSSGRRGAALNESATSQVLEPGLSINTSKPTLNHTFFPWTLPQTLFPRNATCSLPQLPKTLTIEFPSMPQQNAGSALNYMFGSSQLSRLGQAGLLVHNLPGLKMTMLEENMDDSITSYWRVITLGGVNLGRDEKVYFPRSLVQDLSDPLFSKVRHTGFVDTVLQVSKPTPLDDEFEEDTEDDNTTSALYSTDPFEVSEKRHAHLDAITRGAAAQLKALAGTFMRAMSGSPANKADDDTSDNDSQSGTQSSSRFKYIDMIGVTATGKGIGSLLDLNEAPNLLDRQALHGSSQQPLLPWTTVYEAGLSCDGRLPDTAARDHEVIVMRRGGCSFNQKLANIPSFTSGRRSLQLVIVVADDYEYDAETDELRVLQPGDVRPLLDEVQRSPSGIVRRSPIPLILVHGGDKMYELLTQVESIGIRRRYLIESQGMLVENVVVL